MVSKSILERDTVRFPVRLGSSRAACEEFALASKYWWRRERSDEYDTGIDGSEGPDDETADEKDEKEFDGFGGGGGGGGDDEDDEDDEDEDDALFWKSAFDTFPGR